MSIYVNLLVESMTNMTLKVTKTGYFVIDSTKAEYNALKAKNAAIFTGFRWNKEKSRWESAHVVAAIRLRKNFKAAEGVELPMTDAARDFYTAEVARTKDKPRCGRCAGTGAFITYVENGVPKGPGGICFRCEGKGYQDARDEERNDNYDQFAAAQAMMA